MVSWQRSLPPLTPDLYFESRRAASDPASQRGEVPVSGHVHTSSPQSRFAVFLPSQGVSLWQWLMLVILATASSFLPDCTMKEEIHLRWQRTSIMVHSALWLFYLKLSSIYCHPSLSRTNKQLRPRGKILHDSCCHCSVSLNVSLSLGSNWIQGEVRVTHYSAE